VALEHLDVLKNVIRHQRLLNGRSLAERGSNAKHAYAESPHGVKNHPS
jgi:hypothetical protein